jgi:uncharacterized protein YndB with AHSA1/START domain
MSKIGPVQVVTKGEREIVITRQFAAPRDLVFEAHAKPEYVRRWLLGPGGWTMPVCEIDFRVGGKYRYVWRHADGREMALSGVHREIVTPERIVVTQTFDEDWTGGETVGTLVLTEKGGRTTLTNTVLYTSAAAREAALKTGMTDGMEQGYARLDGVLASIKG